jgi:AhpD family alkylhydroperoxidase
MEEELSAIEQFWRERQRQNDAILQKDNQGFKRFFNLDWHAYEDGALDARTKELLGLVASMVLRCDDCIDYHLVECHKKGWKEAELLEAMNVALIVGGSIVIPHLRHAVDTLNHLDELSARNVDLA